MDRIQQRRGTNTPKTATVKKAERAWDSTRKTINDRTANGGMFGVTRRYRWSFDLTSFNYAEVHASSLNRQINACEVIYIYTLPGRGCQLQGMRGIANLGGIKPAGVHHNLIFEKLRSRSPQLRITSIGHRRTGCIASCCSLNRKCVHSRVSYVLINVQDDLMADCPGFSF